MKTISTLSNIAYILAGLALPFTVGKYLIALGILSGVHHWMIDSEYRKFTVVLDYLGMYAVAYAIILTVIGFPLWLTGILAATTALAFQASRVWLGILIGGALLCLGISAGIEPFLHVATYLAIAYVFNHLGDNVHKAEHEILHSAWHGITAYMILLSFNYIV